MDRETPRGRRRQSRGAALLSSIIFTLIAALLVAGGITLAGAHYVNTHARKNSEAALLLAEAGVNDEFSYITKNIYNTTASTRSSQPTTVSGEPYPGRNGKVDGTSGEYWVYTHAHAHSACPNGSVCTDAWSGEGGTLYVTANALVNGAWRRVSCGGPGSVQSIFGMYALFGLNSANSSQQDNIGLPGSSYVTIYGTIGTNGPVQSGQGDIFYQAALNCNYSVLNNKPQFQLPDGSPAAPNDPSLVYDIYTQPGAMVFPNNTQVLKKVITATSGMTDAAAWTYVQTNRENTAKIKQWTSSATATSLSDLSPSKVTSANYPSTGANSTNLANKRGNTLGHWQGINQTPYTVNYGSLGNLKPRQLILPPGDYFFDSLDMSWDGTNPTELVIDNAGLTVGGNPTKQQVRIWINGTSQSDIIGIPIRMTDQNDPSTFRIFYNKDGSVLNFIRASGYPAGETMLVAGAVYSVVGTPDPTFTYYQNVSGLKGTKINFVGGTSSDQAMTLYGALYADRVEFNGHCNIIFASEDITNSNDPPAGVGFVGGYSDG